jgi:DNA invertase Pin-like site-specific DNA recombinase
MSTAIYARVSTRDKQDSENQFLQLRAEIQRRGLPEAIEYVDRVSAKNSTDRTQFLRMMADARKRKFDMVMVWALDRFAREGVYATFGYIEQLRACGVKFCSYSEPFFDTAGPWGEALIAIWAVLAKQERLRIVERVKAGLERAKSQGKVLGRRRAEVDVDEAKRLRAAGMLWPQVAEKLGVSRGSLMRALGRAGQDAGNYC